MPEREGLTPPKFMMLTARPCDECGEGGRLKAVVSRGEHIKYLCHASDKSCYEDLRGNYWGDLFDE